MKALSRALLICVFGAASLVAYCADTLTTWAWHTQVDVTVLTQKGKKTASMIYRKALIRTSGALVPAEAVGTKRVISGESVAIEMTPGRYLFILLRDVPSALDHPKVKESWTKTAEYLEGVGSTSPVTLPLDAYPKLATFGDLAPLHYPF